MSAIGAELHTFLIYAVFGPLLIYPLALLCLRLFQVSDPGQRRLIFLVALLMPLIGFAVYHTVFLKQCEGGQFLFGSSPDFLHLFCLLADQGVRYSAPLLAIVIIAGLLKAAGAALLVVRLRATALEPPAELGYGVYKIIKERSAEMGLKAPELIYSNRKGFAAFTTGLFKPVVVLNLDLIAALSADELDFILTHELAHIRRRDNLKTWLIYLARDLVIVNPLSTILLKQINYETERICDREAIRVTGQQHEQAVQVLLKTWKLMLAGKPRPAGLVSSFAAGKSEMEKRVLTFLGRQGGGRAVSPAVIGLLLFLVFSFSLIYFGVLC